MYRTYLMDILSPMMLLLLKVKTRGSEERTAHCTFTDAPPSARSARVSVTHVLHRVRFAHSHEYRSASSARKMRHSYLLIFAPDME